MGQQQVVMELKWQQAFHSVRPLPPRTGTGRATGEGWMAWPRKVVHAQAHVNAGTCLCRRQARTFHRGPNHLVRNSGAIPPILSEILLRGAYQSLA